MKYIFSILFLLIVFAPLLNSVTSIFQFERKAENRIFHDSLSIDIQRLDDFPKNFENYLSDNFEFRSPLINFFHYLKLNVNHVSPHPENVIIGSNGWLFLAQRDQEVFTGKKHFKPSELTKFKKEWEYRTTYLASKKIECLWVICPFSQYVYEDQLSFNVRAMKSERRVDILKKYLGPNSPELIIDPLQTLISEKNKGAKVFYKNDNHWNLKAGEIVSRLIIKNIKEKFPNYKIPFPENYYWKDSLKGGGILQDFLGIDTLYDQEKFPVFTKELAQKTENYGFPVLASFPYPDQYEIRYEQKDKTNKLRVLIIRDSFGDQLIPFLKEAFGESLFIFDGWNYDLNIEIIEKYKPDLILFIGLETHLENIIN